MGIWNPQRPEEGVRFLGIGVDSCKLACRCWELNLAPLQEQSVILIPELPFQPSSYSLDLVLINLAILAGQGV